MHMQNSNFLTKTRWLVTIILLLSLGIANAWGTDFSTTYGYSDKGTSWRLTNCTNQTSFNWNHFFTYLFSLCQRSLASVEA